ncbi:MAG TPA: hypothetical protein EYP18_07965 [Desulfobacterales bacterium]|nr:hypothetical protein [Desulfobacterales bacterium]
MKYFLFLLLFLQSCAQLSYQGPETDRLILLDQYVSDQDFGKALKLIDETSKEDPQVLELEKRRKTVIEKLRLYEKETVESALKLEQNNEWPAARLSYEEALKKSGPSKVLEDAQQSMFLRLQERIDALEHEELIVTGEWLQKTLFLLEDLHESDPADRNIKSRYHRAQNEAEEIVLQLSQLGEQMLAEKNLAMAGRILPLVAKLSPGPEADAAMDRLKSQLQAKKLKKKKGRKKIAEKKDKKSFESFNKAMAYGKLSEARRFLSQLTPAVKKTMAGKLMQERLQREINDYVQEELSVGNSFYRAGGYEQAIKSWENIIELEPDNEAVKSKIERTQVIIEKLQTLRERQTEKIGSQKTLLN